MSLTDHHTPGASARHQSSQLGPPDFLRVEESGLSLFPIREYVLRVERS